MATKPEEEIHSEEQPKPGSGSSLSNNNVGGTYDEASVQGLTNDTGGVAGGATSGTGGGSTSYSRPGSSGLRTGSTIGSNSTRAGGGGASSDTGAASRNELAEQEGAAGSGASGAVSASERALGNRPSGAVNQVGKGYNAKDTTSLGGISKIKGNLGRFTRKRIAIVAVTAAIGGGGIFGASILSGPFQVKHFAETLGKHFKSNQEFGNDRTSKVLLYALAKKGAQNGRLGITGNFAANKWEARLIKNTGMRPIYSEPGRRHVGFEIVDEAKAGNILGEIRSSDTRINRKLQQTMGEGAEIRSAAAGEFANKDGGIDGKNRVLYLANQSSGERRVWNRTVSSATGVNNVSSYLGSRLLEARGDIKFHKFNRIKDKTDEKLTKAERKKRSDDARKADIKAEGEKGNVKAVATEDPEQDGTAEPSAAGIEVSEEASKAIDSFSGSVAKSTFGGVAIVGVLCAAKSYGNNLEDYKYSQNVLPMMRMGMDGVSRGSQLSSHDDFDIEVMGDFVEYLYSEKTKTSWTNAESIKAEQGKKGGTPIPPEADLGKANAQPKLFEILDSIKIINPACGLIDAVAGLPVLSQASAAISGASTAAIDKIILERFNTSTDQLMESSLKTLTGTTVDPLAEGADLGNFANTGAFLAANDQAVSTGGRPLTDGERANLAMLEESDRQLERSTKSFVAKYFDPADQYSVVGSMVNRAPVNTSQAATMAVSSFNTLGSSFSGMLSSFIPKANAAAYQYDYGVPKFGFSLTEQRNEDFENPYENATAPIQSCAASEIKNGSCPSIEEDIVRLNEDYGKKCFGMTVTFDKDNPDDRVHIKTEDKAINTLKVYNKDKNRDKGYLEECDASKNTTDRFNHYRMYVADAVTAVSLACYEGEESACDEIGAGGGAAADVDSNTEANETAGTNIDIANIRKNSDTIDCAQGTKDLGVEDGYTQGNKVKIRICALPNIKSSGEESNGGFGVSGAGGGAVVNSRVSGAFYALAEAAKADGVDVSALSSFRSMAHQKQLCSGNAGCASGDYTLVAQPGTSNHQLGVAIDFSHGGKGGNSGNCIDVGSVCTLKGEKTWEWLKVNAKKFDIKQYSNEFWHWSPLEN